MDGVLLALLWFLLLYIFVYYNDKFTDVFSPVKFICLIYLLRNIPYFLMVYFDNNKFPEKILQSTNTDIDTAFIQYTLVQTIAFISLIIGIYSYRKKSIKKTVGSILSYRLTKILVFIFAFIGISAFMIFLDSIGGISYLVANLDSRVEIQSGQFILMFLPFLTISVVFIIKLLSIKNKFSDKILLVLMFIVTVISNSSLGGRKNTLYLIVTCVVAYHYFIKRIVFKELNKGKLFLGTFCIVAYIFIIPILRQPNGFEKLSGGEIDFSNEFEIEGIIEQVSYTYIDVFTANYFNYSNIWCFSTFSTISYNLFERQDKNNLPPVDEGVYYYNIINSGRDYAPPFPRNRMELVSLPIENLGFGYANFLLIGVILAFFFQGRIFAYTYQLLIKYSYHPFMVFLYVFMIFNFNFSSLRMFSLLSMLLILFVALFLQKRVENLFNK